MKKLIVFIFLLGSVLHLNVIYAQCNFTFMSKNVSCYGFNDGSATAVPLTGSPPFNFTWNIIPLQDSSTAINLTAGTYIVTVTDFLGCTKTDSVTITQPALLKDTIISEDTICTGICANIIVNVTGGTFPYLYQLTPSTGMEPLTPPYIVCPLLSTTYSVKVTDSNGCIATDQKTIYVASCSGIIYIESLTGVINLYPNPFHTFSNFILPYELNNGSVSIYDILGKRLKQFDNLNGKEIIISREGLANGMYFFRITDGNNIIGKGKMMLE